MASMEDKSFLPETKILDENSDNLMGGSASKAVENRDSSSVYDVKKDADSSTAAIAVTKRAIETETVVESTFDDDFILSVVGKDKIGVGNLSSVSNGSTSVSVNGIDLRVGFCDAASEAVADVDENIKDVSDFKQLSGSVTNYSYALVEGEWDGHGSGFQVGDFVWGKIKSHPWWPGQVYDPRDASEFAVKHSQEGRLLVAFFGDGSCSWCLPSQLVPFIENFKEMSMDSSSRSFFNAMENATDEIGRLVEANMTCKCIPLEKRVGLARPVVANAGVKAGVLVPDVDICRLPIPEYGAAEVLEEVRNLAKGISVNNLLEVAVMRSWLSAFYFARGSYQLPVYCDPVYIVGLEDKNKNSNAVIDDLTVPVEVPIIGPLEDDWLSSSPAVNSAKSQNSSDDKIYHRRKQKSVADLMAENDVIKPKSQKRAGGKEGKDVRKSAASGKKRKRNYEEVEEEGSQKEVEVAFAENTSYEAKGEFEKASSPRERKKSKYLSPPYTNPIWTTGNSSFKMESESDNINRINRVKTKTLKSSGDLSASHAVSDFVDEASEEELANGRVKKLVKNDDKKLTFAVSDVDLEVDELLLNMQFAAVDPLYLSKKGSLDMVWAFLSALRSSTYLHGPDYKIFQKCKKGSKRKSLLSRLGNQENDIAHKKAKLHNGKTPKLVGTEGKSNTSKSKKAAESSRSKVSSPKQACEEPMDDMMSDVEAIRQKVEIMSGILENCHSKFSTEDKSSLKDEMKHLMENVEIASEKVRVMAENTSS